MREIAVIILTALLITTTACGSNDQEAATSIIEGPAFILFYTDN